MKIGLQIGFNGISIFLGLFSAKTLENHVPCTLIFTFLLIWFSLVGFYGIVGYLIPNFVYVYILNIYITGKHIWLIFLNEPELFLHTVK